MSESSRLYSVRVEIIDPLGRRFCAASKIEPKAVPFIQPVDVCDDPFVAQKAGRVAQTQMKNIKAARNHLAREIALNITDQLVAAFDRQDTSNGYPR